MSDKKLIIQQATDYDLVWWDKESGGNQDGSYWKPHLPDDYFAIGHYGQSGYGEPHSPIIIVKPKEGFDDAIAYPTGYTKIWDDSGSGADKSASFWLPTPPDGYVACGVVVSDDGEPGVEEVVCIREDLTRPATSGSPIWLDIDTGSDDDFGSWYIQPTDNDGISANTFYAVASHDSPSSNPAWHCLDAHYVEAPDPLSLDEIQTAIQTYGPLLHLHPDEKFLPTSVGYFAENADLLEKSTGTKTQAHVNDLPQGKDNGDKYQLALKDESARHGDFDRAKAYVHAKATSVLYTDLQFWFFYAYNGHGTFRLKALSFGQTLREGNTSAEPIGEHEGDWEHATIRISNFTRQPEAIYLSQHSGGVWVPWSVLTFDNQQPKLYASINGHATYFGIGSNYTEHRKIPNSNLSPAAIEFFLVNETKDGGECLDCSQQYAIINADYLGDQAPPQPSWVNYWGRWGTSKEGHFTEKRVAEIILKNCAVLLAPLGIAGAGLVGTLAVFLVPLINVDDQDGPTAPIAKGNWAGRE